MTTKALPVMYTANNVTLIFKGKTHIIAKSASNYPMVVDALKNGDWDRVIEAANLRTAVTLLSDGRVKIMEDNSVYLDGVVVHGTLVERMLEMFREGFDIKPMIRFLENLSENPTESAKDELYSFLEATNLPLTPDGHFLAYKMVNSEYLDIHSTTMDNSLGKTVSMPREQVDSDRNVTCSTGLHVCSESYLASAFGNPDKNDRVIIVKVNPRDVVSVPVDYNNSKMRTCQYVVVDELADWAERVKGLFVKDYVPSYESAEDVESAWQSSYESPDEDDDSNYDDEDEDDLDDLDDDLLDEDDLDVAGVSKWWGFQQDEPQKNISDTVVENIEKSQSYGITLEKLEQIRKIRKMAQDGWTTKAISDVTGVSPRQVGRIASGEAWAHVK